MLAPWMFSILAGSGADARLSVLIFHRVLPEPDPLAPGEIDAERFATLCGWVRRWFNVLPLGEAAERLFCGDLPQRALAITFDDGYADNLTVAAPVLRAAGLPCTFFIATGFLDGGIMWNDRLIESVRRTRLDRLDLRQTGAPDVELPLSSISERRQAVNRLIRHAKYLQPEARLQFVDEVVRRSEADLPADLMLTTTQLKELAGTPFDLGAHTESHPILAKLGFAEARREIEASRACLERLTNRRIALFAYPNGKPHQDYGADAVRAVREAGFAAAVSTSWGVSTRGTDRFQLARFTPWDRGRTRFAVRMAQNYRRAPQQV